MAQAFKYGGVRNMARTGRFTMSEFKQRIRMLNQRQCTTAAQIDATLSEMAELTRDATVKGVLMILIEEFQALVAITPADTGRARASWMMTGDRSDVEKKVPEYKRTNPKPPGADPEKYILPEYRNLIRETINNASLGLSGADIVYVVNNMEYILALNAGWSKQQPAGFIDGFLLRVKRRLQDLATELSQVR